MEAGAAPVTPTPPVTPPTAGSSAPPAPASSAPPPTPTPAPAAAGGSPPPAAEPKNLLATEDPAAGGTGANGTEAPKAVPVELKLPEGFKETPALAEFKTLAGEVGLKSEVAQKILDTYLKSETQRQEAVAADWKAKQAGWQQSLRADKEFGGAAYDQNVKTAHTAIAKFGDAELRELLNTTWIGNHPALVRYFHKVGTALSEDSVRGTSGGSSANPPSKEDQLKVLYPTHYSKKE